MDMVCTRLSSLLRVALLVPVLTTSGVAEKPSGLELWNAFFFVMGEGGIVRNLKKKKIQ
jgi:hypothetical protein